MVVMLGPGRPSIAALMAATLDPGDLFWGIINAVSGMTVHSIQEKPYNLDILQLLTTTLPDLLDFFEMVSHNYRSQCKPRYGGIIVSLVFPFSLW